uniref:Cyclic nucleotide-binding domain-containing protein n=1 Tax=Guillardia theta TaxID=55529 RepID=A0A7S4L0I2_GUITH
MGMISTPTLEMELTQWEKERESSIVEPKAPARLVKSRRLSPKNAASKGGSSSRQWFSHSFDEGRKYGVKSEEGRQSPSTLSSLMQPVLWKASWRQFTLFRSMSTYNVCACIEVMKVKSFQEGEKIIKKGTIGTTMYFLDSGKAAAMNDDTILEELETGSCFGEMTFLATCRRIVKDRVSRLHDASEVQRSCDVVAMETCRCFELSVSNFLAVVGHREAHRLLANLEPVVVVRKARIRKSLSPMKQCPQYPAIQLEKLPKSSSWCEGMDEGLPTASELLTGNREYLSWNEDFIRRLSSSSTSDVYFEGHLELKDEMEEKGLDVFCRVSSGRMKIFAGSDFSRDIGSLVLEDMEVSMQTENPCLLQLMAAEDESVVSEAVQFVCLSPEERDAWMCALVKGGALLSRRGLSLRKMSVDTTPKGSLYLVQQSWQKSMMRRMLGCIALFILLAAFLVGFRRRDLL